MKTVTNESVTATIDSLLRKRCGRQAEKPVSAGPEPLWEDFRRLGSELWLDTGDIERAESLWSAEFSGLTTNNTLLNNEVQKGIYDDLIQEARKEIDKAAPETTEDVRVREIGLLINVFHAFRLAERFSSKVSVELHTDLAYDAGLTCEYARRIHRVCPERFIIKVPLTLAGLVATRRLEKEGIPVNMTLGFSARQNYFAAAFANPHFVNVFLGRLNAFLLDRKLGDGKNAGEKATQASARGIIALRRGMASKTRQIGASLREPSQLVDLAGLDVLTIPPDVAESYCESHITEDRPALVGFDGRQFPVEIAHTVDRSALRPDQLWEIPRKLVSIVEELRGAAADSMTPERLRSLLGERQFRDLFPAWTRDDLKLAARDGKIPDPSSWAERLALGDVSIDSLCNLHGLVAFAKDQSKLDKRIRELLS